MSPGARRPGSPIRPRDPSGQGDLVSETVVEVVRAVEPTPPSQEDAPLRAPQAMLILGRAGHIPGTTARLKIGTLDRTKGVSYFVVAGGRLDSGAQHERVTRCSEGGERPSKLNVADSTAGMSRRTAGENQFTRVRIRRCVEVVGDAHVAFQIERAVETVLAEGVTVPRDLGGDASCTAMTEAICRALG